MTFYSKLCHLCAQQKTNPTAVCRAIGLSDAAATRWRKGSTPHDTTIRAIAQHFKIDPNYFYETEISLSMEEIDNIKRIKSAEAAAAMAHFDALDKLIQLFHQVPEKDRELVVNMVEAALQTRSAKPDTDEKP